MMAYFPNGTSGEIFMHDQCAKCVNWRDKEDGFGCPIMDIHMVYNYGQKGETKEIMTALIPDDKERLCAGECSMFLANADKAQQPTTNELPTTTDIGSDAQP